MGLDIYFLKKNLPVALSPDQAIPLAEPEKIGYYRKFNALLNWVETHVGEVDNCADVPLARNNLLALLDTLNNLTPDNCSTTFPTEDGFYFGSQEYNADYWLEVNDLKQFIQTQLASFDFNHHQLCFHAWW